MQADKPSHSLRWIAIGDSFSTGEGDTSENGGWIQRTVENFAATGPSIEILNYAERGAKIGRVLELQGPQLGQRSEIVSAIAGANDVLERSLMMPQLLEGFQELVRRSRNSGSLVITSTCPDFFRLRYGSNSKLGSRVRALNQLIRAEAAAHGDTLLLETDTVLESNELWCDDRIHPNPEGHEALAASITALLREWMIGRSAQSRPNFGYMLG